tara:strand:+ start:294 stop:704 length:411 start_codon:yes stop_codon:yes gene_type:complete
MRIIEWIKKNEESIKSLIISGFLAFGVLFVGRGFVEQIFVWGNLQKWFGFNSIYMQMNFCMHQAVLIFALTTLTMGFVIDKLALKKNNNIFSRKIFWIILLVMSISYIIGHYQNIYAMGNYYDEILFDKLKYLICY